MTQPRIASNKSINNLQTAIQASSSAPMNLRQLEESERKMMRLFKILLEINREHQIVDTSSRPTYPRLV